MSDSRTLERRFRLTDPMTPGSRLCRVCWEVIVLEPGYIETTFQHVYVRCPHCGGSFPVRHSDVEKLKESGTPTS